MTLEFEIDDFRNALGNSVVKSGADVILRQECERIMDKHKKAMIEELQKLISGFAVHVITEPMSAIRKMRITLPDA